MKHLQSNENTDRDYYGPEVVFDSRRNNHTLYISLWVKNRDWPYFGQFWAWFGQHFLPFLCYRLFDTPPGISLINIMGLVLMTLDPLVLAGLGLMLLWLIGS